MKLEEIKLLECWYDGQFYIEEFRDVVGREGVYSISNFGRVFVHPKIVSQKSQWGKNMERPYGGFLMKQHIAKNTGYFSVCLTNGKIETKISVHRLIAIAFIPNPENKPQVNHIDGVKTNIFFKNLEWNTPKENVQHAYKTGLSKSGEHHKDSKPISQYTLCGQFIKTWPSSGEIKRTLGISTGCISSCARGERPTAHGFIWKRL
jgi:hypothetical protein